MNISLKQGQLIVTKMGVFWVKHLRLFFFLIFIGIFLFSVFEWYRMVYAPEDRTNTLKEKILQSEKENFDMKKFEHIVDALEKRNAEQPETILHDDPFYP